MRTRGFVVMLAVAAIGIPLVLAQTAKQKTKTGRAKTTSLSKAKADSIAAAARSDSLKTVAHTKAVVDSLRRVDSLAKVAADSAKMFRWRKIEHKAFRVGERLVFDVSYGPITAGEAVMAIPRYETLAGRNCYRV